MWNESPQGLVVAELSNNENMSKKSNASETPFLQVQSLCKYYVLEKPIFADANFTINKGEFVCIIGHSGCGKTTILNVLAGLDTASEGYVIMDGREVKGPSLERGVVFQSHALMPWSIQPKMLLLDEPFGALDALTRGTIQEELIGIVRDTHQTVFMITHDVDEAILLADKIVLMKNAVQIEGSYTPGGVAEILTNTLPKSRKRAELHHLDGYYELRNHIVDFLIGMEH